MNESAQDSLVRDALTRLRPVSAPGWGAETFIISDYAVSMPPRWDSWLAAQANITSELRLLEYKYLWPFFDFYISMYRVEAVTRLFRLVTLTNIAGQNQYEQIAFNEINRFRQSHILQSYWQPFSLEVRNVFRIQQSITQVISLVETYWAAALCKQSI